MRFFSGLLILTLLSFPCLASTSVGNGGNAVICSSPTPDVSTLDVFEAKRLDPAFSVELGKADQSWREKVNVVFGRLSRLSPQRSALYQRLLEQTDFQYSSEKLPNLNDYGQLLTQLPSNCEVVQAAYQTVNPFRIDRKTITFSTDLAQRLQRDGYVSLIVHEVVTMESSALGLTTSESIRPFVALILSEKINSLSFKEFTLALQRSGLRDFEFLGFPLRFIDEEGRPSLPVFDGEHLVSAEIDPHTQVSTADGIFFASQRVEFSRAGKLKSFALSSHLMAPYPSKRVWPAGTTLHLDADNHVVEFGAHNVAKAKSKKL